MNIKFSKTQIKQLKRGIAHKMGFAPESILIDEFCKARRISPNVNIKYALCGWIHIQTKTTGEADFHFDKTDMRKGVTVDSVMDVGHVWKVPACDNLKWIDYNGSDKYDML